MRARCTVWGKTVAAVIGIFVLCAHPQGATAAALLQVSDEMSLLTPNAYSNHEIRFKTLAGATDPGDTIVVTFAAGFDLSALTLSDIRLSTGPTGTENLQTIAAFPGTGSWGVSITSPAITFTHPTSGGDIAGLDIVLIRIGTNAGGTNRIKNPSSAGSRVTRITGTFGDVGALAVAITNASVGITTGATGGGGGSQQPPETPLPTIDEYLCPIFTPTHLITGTTTIGTIVFVNNESFGVTQYPSGAWDSLRALTMGPNTFYAFAQSTGNGISSASVSRRFYRYALGDTNGDGRVDDFDLAGLAAHWEEYWCPADFNNDGIDDDFDLSVMAWYWTS